MQHVTNSFSFYSFYCVRFFVDSVQYLIFHTIGSIDILNPFPASHFMSASTLSYANEKWRRKNDEGLVSKRTNRRVTVVVNFERPLHIGVMLCTYTR